jgi:hypothetical protein
VPPPLFDAAMAAEGKNFRKTGRAYRGDKGFVSSSFLGDAET